MIGQGIVAVFLGVASVFKLLLHLFKSIFMSPDLSFLIQMWEGKY